MDPQFPMSAKGHWLENMDPIEQDLKIFVSFSFTYKIGKKFGSMVPNQFPSVTDLEVWIHWEEKIGKMLLFSAISQKKSSKYLFNFYINPAVNKSWIHSIQLVPTWGLCAQPFVYVFWKRNLSIATHATSF